MGTVIKSCYATADVPKSAIDMAALAAKRCVAQTGVPLEEIDLLINIGVFRDDNIIEPAIAPLIQRKLGLNLDPVKNNHIHRSTFAFDINDGENGFLTAACVADSFFKTRSIQYALIVAGDIHPSQTDHPDFPFTPVASAALLAHTEGDRRGFGGFHFKSSANGSAGFCANVDLSQNKTGNRDRMTFYAPEHYEDRLGEFAAGMLHDLTARGEIEISGVDYLVVSGQTANFGAQLMRALHLDGKTMMAAAPVSCGDAHTSALPLHFQQLTGSGRLQENQSVLFVSAGAGLSAACAIYTV